MARVSHDNKSILGVKPVQTLMKGLRRAQDDGDAMPVWVDDAEQDITLTARLASDSERRVSGGLILEASSKKPPWGRAKHFVYRFGPGWKWHGAERVAMDLHTRALIENRRIERVGPLYEESWGKMPASMYEELDRVEAETGHKLDYDGMSVEDSDFWYGWLKERGVIPKK